MKKSKLFLLIVGLCLSLGVSAQNVSGLRINEYCVVNTAGVSDEYGTYGAWIEVFNTTYGTVDIAGCYLSNDPDNPKMYFIDKGEKKTKIPPRGYYVFWADNQSAKGQDHLNFDLASSNSIILTATDGMLIDQVEIATAARDTNVVYGRVDDGKDIDSWEVKVMPTPGYLNRSNLFTEYKLGELAEGEFDPRDVMTKSEKMIDMDPHGWMMAVIAMSVVFCALIILCFLFKGVGALSMRSANKKSAAAAPATGESAKHSDTSADTYAAIAMALELYMQDNEAHDEESDVLTKVHTDRSYSPWSSKIYTLRQTPQLKKK